MQIWTFQYMLGSSKNNTVKISRSKSLKFSSYTLFYKQHFYKQSQAGIGKKLSKC